MAEYSCIVVAGARPEWDRSAVGPRLSTEIGHGPWASNGVKAQVCLPSSIKHKRHSAVAPYLTEKFRQSSTKGHAAITPHLTEKFRGGRAATASASTAAAAPVSHRTGQGAVLFDLR